MSVNAWVGLVIVVVPMGMLLIVGAAMRICLLLFGDEQADNGSRTSSGTHLRRSRSASPDASFSTLARRPGVGHS
jgi:hypothetical protein